ncbi:DUF3574 domain-containing protein [Pseudoalteromonas sp. T1lg23B]|uniref:DUF3574 domain-containing protein n=1 Tax=Pseudoalteromonas sp. T1lg23B TaxID=2077097 RepID=UPI000CF6EA37|nr:DUF3574 domain-containing protein [Pseudoalteromonas sp. T1lg23B]
MSVFIKSVIIAFTCTIISACTLTSNVSQCDSGMTERVQESLYFGTGMKKGFVTKKQWQTFLDNYVTPQFPNGFTVVEASGQWKGNNGVLVREPSFVLTVVHNNEQRHATAIKVIIDEYKTQFQQEAVLRIKMDSCVSF